MMTIAVFAWTISTLRVEIVQLLQENEQSFYRNDFRSSRQKNFLADLTKIKF
jgi:hypothetical protein